MAGVGYAAVGTVHGTASTDRDYHYGVAPQALLALRLIYGDKAALDVTGREYFVSDVAAGTTGGHDNIVRVDAALTLARLASSTRSRSATSATAATRASRRGRPARRRAARSASSTRCSARTASARSTGAELTRRATASASLRRRVAPAQDGGGGRSARRGSRRG